MMFRKKNYARMAVGAKYFTISGIVRVLSFTSLIVFAACQNISSKTEKQTIKANTVNKDSSKIKIPVNISDKKVTSVVAEHDFCTETTNIGLMLSTRESKSELALAALHGAKLAINHANSVGGFNQKDFKLLVRYCDGPWGAAAKEVVSLITEYNVTAILASLDGRNAHLIEQVATKAKVMMVSSRATDPTLSQAFVPWYFRCVPDDNQQAKVLADEIINKRKPSKFIIVSDNGYDGKLAAGCFVKQLKKIESPVPQQLFYDLLKPDFNNLLNQIQASGIQNIILFGGPENSLRLIKKLSETEMDYTLYGPISVLGESATLKEFWKYAEKGVFISADFWFTTKGMEFQNDFLEQFGYLPGPVAAYAYDGMNVIIEAIRKGGTDRENIIQSMKSLQYNGATGSIEFERYGNRKGIPDLLEIRNGKPVEAK
ncbi:MAG: ABC transporter substrate-binding protein [Bacteroidales bacterium]|nr:ABC transporter substrate-binding protein [Bacteroidales bacterium]